MDLYKAIRSLYEEKKRLDRLIQSLESMQARGAAEPAAKTRSRRGRRSMSADERRQVSDRMKKYWDQRRQQNGQAHSQGPAGSQTETPSQAPEAAKSLGASPVA